MRGLCFFGSRQQIEMMDNVGQSVHNILISFFALKDFIVSCVQHFHFYDLDIALISH